MATDKEILDAAAKNAAYIMKLEAGVERLRKILYSYRTYYKAAMRATSLGLCKRVIKHATEDDRKLNNGG